MYHTIRRHQRLTRNDVMKELEELKKISAQPVGRRTCPGIPAMRCGMI